VHAGGAGSQGPGRGRRRAAAAELSGGGQLGPLETAMTPSLRQTCPVAAAALGIEDGMRLHDLAPPAAPVVGEALPPPQRLLLPPQTRQAARGARGRIQAGRRGRGSRARAACATVHLRACRLFRAATGPAARARSRRDSTLRRLSQPHSPTNRAAPSASVEPRSALTLAQAAAAAAVAALGRVPAPAATRRRWEVTAATHLLPLRTPAPAPEMPRCAPRDRSSRLSALTAAAAAAASASLPGVERSLSNRLPLSRPGCGCCGPTRREVPAAAFVSVPWVRLASCLLPRSIPDFVALLISAFKCTKLSYPTALPQLSKVHDIALL
jgi:hypothetical protein